MPWVLKQPSNLVALSASAKSFATESFSVRMSIREIPMQVSTYCILRLGADKSMKTEKSLTYNFGSKIKKVASSRFFTGLNSYTA